MAEMVQAASKRIALLHRYSASRIKKTNAAFPYLVEKGMDVLTFRTFPRLGGWKKHLKSALWVVYAPMLVWGKHYDVIYCDDSYPFYPLLVKAVSPRSKVVLRLGDFHLMYYTRSLVYRFLHSLEKIVWRCADEIIAISEAMADYIQAEIGRRPKVVLDPVDPEDFHVNGNGRGHTVMFHGVLTKNKQVDLLLEAARRMPETGFEIAGDGPDGARLKRLAGPNVLFSGWQPLTKVVARIASCGVGVALRSENPGNQYVVTSPFLQYGAMGKPCLVTRRKVFGDYPWQFTGADEMVEKLKVLMEKPEEGRKLRAYVLEHHDARKIAGEIWTILKSA